MQMIQVIGGIGDINFVDKSSKMKEKSFFLRSLYGQGIRADSEKAGKSGRGVQQGHHIYLRKENMII